MTTHHQSERPEEPCCEEHAPEPQRKNRKPRHHIWQNWNPASVWRAIAIGVLAILLFSFFFDVNITPKFSWDSVKGTATKTTVNTNATSKQPPLTNTSVETASYENDVLSPEGIELPIAWGDFGKQMVDAGVIDKEKFDALYTKRGGLSEAEQALAYGTGNTTVTMNLDNAGILLNLLWAFGLANKNTILETGPMQDPQYGGAAGFASTGGWSLAKGEAMDHYSKHEFVKLTADQQALVERVSKNIYRPCCGNSVYFPDCNHGMAMLGLLELMAGEGVGEAEMYQVALQVNAYWFPQTYVTIAKYLETQGQTWKTASPQELLGAAYSSSSGYRTIASKVEPATPKGGSGCGV